MQKPHKYLSLLLFLLLIAGISHAQTTRYVKAGATGSGATWANASGDLQAIINASADGDQVWVAAGTYKPTSDVSGNTSPSDLRTKTFVMKAGVKIYGSFVGTESSLAQRTQTVMVSNPSVLSGDFNGDDIIAGIGSSLTITFNTENAYRVLTNQDNGLDNNAVLDGFTISGGNANGAGLLDMGGGIFNLNSSPWYNNLIFTGNNAFIGGGMSIAKSNSKITNSVFKNNIANYFGGGVYFTRGSYIMDKIYCLGNKAIITGGGIGSEGATFTMTNAVIVNNYSQQDGGGISTSFGSVHTITNTTLTNNTAVNGGGVYASFSGTAILKNCIIWGNSSAVYKDESIPGLKSNILVSYSIVQGGYTGAGNLNQDPLFVNAVDPDGSDNLFGTADDGLRPIACSPVINVGDNTDVPDTDTKGQSRIVGGTVDMGAYEFQGRLYVNASAAPNGDGSSWATAYNDLQTALANARLCDQITEIWVAAGTYKPSSTGDRNAAFVMKAGVKIYGGFPNTGNPAFADRNWNTNKTILSGDLNGDDVITGSGSTLSITNNSENSYHVIFNNDNGMTTTNSLLDGFTIRGGNANGSLEEHKKGGGMYSYNASTSIENVLFEGNSASRFGGGLCLDFSHSAIANTQFEKNYAGEYGGGMANIYARPSLTNILFAGNNAPFGGAIGNNTSYPIITNATIAGNYSASKGSAIYSSSGEIAISNSIIWGHGSDAIVTRFALLSINYSITEEVVSGIGNLSSNPRFVDAANGDYRLQACSPAINAGDNTGVSGIDIVGNPRIFGTTVDMGAYEYQSAPPVAIIPTVTPTHPTTCGGMDGSITLSGFLNNTTYSIAYKKDNNAVAAANFTSSSSGILTLTGLGAGSYTDIVATYGTCVSNAATATLTDPIKPSLTLSMIPAICAGAMSFTIPYINPIGSPNKYSISGAGITGVTDGDLTNPITVTLSPAAAGSSISFTLTLKNTATNCISNNITGSVTVDPVSVGGSIAGSVTVCSGTNSTVLTLSGQTGTIQKWQSSLNSDFSSVTDISNTSNQFTANNLTQTTYYRAVVKSGVCSEANSATATVTVDPVSVGGSIAGSTTVCSGTNSTVLTLSGQTGTIQKWQSSLNSNFSSVTDISNTSNQFTANNLTQMTYYRAVVKSGVCSEANSATATVTVDPVSVGGSIAGSVTVCSGTNSSVLTLSGQTGTIQKWQSSLNSDFSSVTDITNTSNQFTASNLTQTTYYRSVVKSGVCSEANSATATVTVDPVSVGGSIAGSVTVCSGTNSTVLTLSGQTGTIQKWQSSLNSDFSSAANITNTTNQLTANNLTQTTYYRAVVKSGVCSEANSATATVTVDPVSVGGSIAGSATVCSGTNSTVLTLSGQTGTIQKWQSSLTSDFSSVTDITNTSNQFTASNLTQTTYYRSMVKSGVCSQTNSATATVTVDPVSVGGSIAGSATVCSGTNSTALTLSGQTGTIQKWQSSLTSDFSSATDISNTSNQFTANNLTQTTYYRAVVKSGVCSEANSTTATVTVDPVSVGGSIAGSTTVCSGTNSTVLTLSGQTGTIQKWQSSLTSDFSSVTDIVNITNQFIANNLTKDTYYRVVVKNGICSEANSLPALVQVHRKPTVSLNVFQQSLAEGSEQTLCDTDGNPVNGLQFTVSSACVVGNPVWRVQVGNGTWSDWSTSSPTTQLSNNQPHRYQAACDANCLSTYTQVIALTLNYRASTPQNVSVVADGTTVLAGEEKSICDQVGDGLTFNASCATGERLLYSVDGGVYLPQIPSQIVDGNFHNYRVRCQKSDGTPSCFETESGLMRLKISTIVAAPVASLSVTSGCGTPSNFIGMANCGSLTTVWYNATTNVALPNLPNTTPNETTSYYARCQGDAGCQSGVSNTVTFTVVPVNTAPVITVSSDLVCTGMSVTVSANCPAGSKAFWNTGVSENSFSVSFNNVTTQGYSAKCVFDNGCQSAVSDLKTVRWKAFELTIINIGQSKSAIKTNDRAAWASQFVTADGGPNLDNSTEINPTLYYTENANKTGPRYWTIHADACALGTNGSLTFDMLLRPESGVAQSFNTHENNAPYFMYANREGYTELYAQNHPAYGFYLDNGAGGNVYDAGLPKGLFKLGIRYWDQKGQGSIYPSTRQPQGNVLAYQEFWFRIQSKDGVGVGAARVSGLPFTVEGLGFAEVAPNPVFSVMRLKVTDAKNQKVNISLIDASGRTLLQRGFVPETNAHQEEFEVSELANGMYFLKVNAGEKQATLKVVKVQ